MDLGFLQYREVIPYTFQQYASIVCAKRRCDSFKKNNKLRFDLQNILVVERWKRNTLKGYLS